jgi:hypothetical protein
MTITTKFKFSWPEGVTPVYHDLWVKTLSPSDHAKYDAAESRQKAIKDADAAAGTAITNSDGSITRTKDVTTPDQEWVSYWMRYIDETKTIFEIVHTEDN